MVIYFSFAAPNFLSAANLVLMSKHVALNAFLAIGMTFVIITGGIDLSVGSIVGLCGMVAGGLILHGVDLQNGYTLFFNIPEIMRHHPGARRSGRPHQRAADHPAERRAVHRHARHALYRARRGAAGLGRRDLPQPRGQRRASAPPATPSSAPARSSACRSRSGCWSLVALAAAYLARWTPLGRHIFAVGGNERAAALSGIRVNRVKLFVYMFSGFCAAIVGLIISSELLAAHPATGTTFELNAIAAAVLGGTSMSGGRGTIGGTIIGAFVIGILSDGLVMMGVSSFWQMVIKGVVIIAAVVVDQAQRKLQQRVALQQMAQLA